MADGYSRNGPSAGSAQAAAVSKAQQFEDEKRRIIQSCFSKTEQDGSRACHVPTRLAVVILQ